MPLDKSILSATEIFQNGIRTNDLDAVIKALEPHIHNSLWHALLHTLVVMAMAGSTMDQVSFLNFKYKNHLNYLFKSVI